MRIKLYGTRGSVPIANSESVRFGGNTTCVRIMSECIPPRLVLGVDAGTGFVPMSYDILQEGELEEIFVLFTHYHHDHTQGLFLSPLMFMKNIKMKLCGPVEMKIGVKEAIADLMRPPYFPVHCKEVRSHIHYKNLEFPKTIVVFIHPQGGYKFMNLDDYERLANSDKFAPIGKGRYPINECLVITMYKSHHPEYTISYRFEEKPTGKVFVFLTDHENEDGVPNDFKNHLNGVDLLIMDAQYSRATYDARTSGFGHGTPDYCISIAETVEAKKLGLTHHDPDSKDSDIEDILREAKKKSNSGKIKIFSCADYQEIEV